MYKIVTQDSVEEKILQMQEKKKAMSRAIVNGENSSMYQMGTERLLDIFTTGNDSRADGEELDDFDLDALMESFADEYASLTATEFSKSLLS